MYFNGLKNLISRNEALKIDSFLNLPLDEFGMYERSSYFGVVLRIHKFSLKV